MTEIELLLTQEYADYNQKIQIAFEDKKELEADFKAKFTAYKEALAEIEESVASTHESWKKWVAANVKNEE